MMTVSRLPGWLAGLLVFAALAAFSGASASGPTIEEAMSKRVLGDPDAPVEIIEYASMTCPHCATFHLETLPQIKERYIDTGKAKLVMRDFPLDNRAAAGTLLARCAPPARYFPLIDVMFKQQQVWAGANDVLGELARIGKFAGMSQSDVEACFQNEELFQAIVQKRQEYMAEHDVSSTPTFYINGEKISGAQPFSTFEEVIEKHLN